MKQILPDFTGYSPLEIANKLDAGRKRLRGIYGSYGAVYLAALALYFVDTRAMALLFFANVMAGFLFVRPQDKAYKDATAHAHLLLGLSQDIDGLQHNTKGAVTREEMAERQLVPQYKQSFLSRETVSGSLRGMPILLSDITSPYQTAEGEKRKILWVSGCMVSLQLPADTGLNMRVVDREFLSYPDRQLYFCEQEGLFAIPVEQEEFLHHFTVYAKEPQAVSRELTAKLLALRDFTPCKLALSLQGDHMTVVLKGRFLGNAALSGLKNPVTIGVLQAHPLPELSRITDIARLCAKGNR